MIRILLKNTQRKPRIIVQLFFSEGATVERRMTFKRINKGRVEVKANATGIKSGVGKECSGLLKRTL